MSFVFQALPSSSLMCNGLIFPSRHLDWVPRLVHNCALMCLNLSLQCRALAQR